MLKGRLKAIYDKLIDSKYLIDIGTDHGYIPIKAVKDKLVEKAFAADVRFGPCKIAKKNIMDFKLQEQIKVVLSDGFDEFIKSEYSFLDANFQVVIAGMGGTLITELLNRGLELVHKSTQLIIQPQNNIEFCRQWLFKNGFKIIDEVLVKDINKLYVIMAVNFDGIPCEYDDIDILIGPILKLASDELLKEYIDKLIKRRARIIDGLKKAKGDKRSSLEQQTKELALLKKWRLKIG